MPPAPPALGFILPDRYAVDRELGRGGMATVYLAWDRRETRRVALKILRPEVASALGTARFLREIQLARGLEHPHIVALLDWGELDGTPYYSMPYVAGESLRTRLACERQLPLGQALGIAREITAALGCAHARGIVHRDIKPENILLERTEAGIHALVADFGIAQALSVAGGERLTATGVAVGTPAYMSPEEAGGQEVDGRSDIYSLGCVLYEMLGGEPPYTGLTGQAIIAKRLHEPIPQLRALRPEVPEFVEQAVTKALAKAPADRFATAEEFAAALTPAETVPMARHRPGRLVHRLAVGAVVTAAAVAASTALLRQRSPRASAEAPPVRRVVVAVFQNQTADTALDPLGHIVADYLARGLAETRLVEVVDARADQAGDSAAGSGGIAGASALARRLGAGSVIWGSYSRRGDSLEFQAQFTDAATGNPITAVLPAMGSAVQQTQGVEALRQHVMSALAARLDPRLARFADVSASRATSYEAYREFLAGDTLPVLAGVGGSYHNVDSVGLQHYRRAYALDTNFTLPLVLIATNSVLGNCAVTDSIAEVLRPRHDRLPPYDRARLDLSVAWCHGQREKALEISRQAMVAAPRSDGLVHGYAYLALTTGRLREAIAVTEKLDRMRNEHVPAYWGIRVISYHVLGEHQRELELAQEARRLFPADREVLLWEAQALVGLGRLAEVRARVDAMTGVPPQVPLGGWGPTDYLSRVGHDLRAHGYRQEAQALFERGIRWIKARPAAEQQDLRFDLATRLYDAERYDEAWPILKQVALQHLDDMHVQATLGAVAARRGDLEEVARIDRWLAGRTSRYWNGPRTFNRARLAAILGDRDRAVELYRQALEQGLARYGYDRFGVHSDPDFESLRDYPPFRELMRPKD